MTELITTHIRKKNKASLAGIILAFSMVFAVCFFVNIFVGEKSPVKSLTMPFLLATILLLIWWIVLYNQIKNKMILWVDNNSDFGLSVQLKGGEEIRLNKISAIEPVWGKLSVGQGPKMKDVYLKLYDENGKNSLTLNTNLGAIYDAPDGFFELNERELLNYDKGMVMYFCSRTVDVYTVLRDGKWITVKQPM